VKTYRQYCPIARASEILAQRWTPIIIRELLNGPASYTRLADAAPGIPRSLLTSRLRDLQRIELVETTSTETSKGSLYRLTAAGEDLADVIGAIGKWGERWLEVAPEHADPGYLLNSWCTTYLAIDQLPEQRVVVRFDFTDQPRSATPLWMVFDEGDAEVCRTHPGYDEDLIVQAESVAIAEWHLGRIEWADALRQQRIQVEGPTHIAKRFPTWNRRSRWVAMNQSTADNTP
jgi:DNA-binding HxlR family transcriptional regulator